MAKSADEMRFRAVVIDNECFFWMGCGLRDGGIGRKGSGMQKRAGKHGGPIEIRLLNAASAPAHTPE